MIEGSGVVVQSQPGCAQPVGSEDGELAVSVTPLPPVIRYPLIDAAVRQILKPGLRRLRHERLVKEAWNAARSE